MEIPESMKDELAAWNSGKGIDLESWVGCEGNFKLAVGYASIFWPNFVEFEGYIFTEGFSKDSVRGFESQKGSTPKSVEWVINHLHIADIQHYGCSDIAKDKLLVIGKTLKEIYELKLRALFPEKPCIVEFYVPDDEDDLMDYQVSFWQAKHEADNA
ncbi:hypothetical protein [Saccharospirillum alexandrii]|uniref:hypothetical protein n=1 Tax=Saccharospirillum alexandrii TaxID=2448477 RepID=UPI000FD92BEC|nr:hypothetical protein [Saccharospirillum alexandrii]